MITINPADLEARAAYRLAISIVLPRPIAWVSTLGADGTLNLAPFSFFNVVAGIPVTLMVSISRRKGEPKDTLRNATETGEFVVNIADQSLTEKLNHTSGEWAYAVNEFEQAGLEPIPSEVVRPPRVGGAPVAMEARLTQVIPVQDSDYTLILGQVVRFHIREDLLKPDGLVDVTRLHPLARLGGDDYGLLGDVITLARPKVT